MKNSIKRNVLIFAGVLLLSSCGENTNTNQFTPNINVNSGPVPVSTTNEYFNFNENVPFWFGVEGANTNNAVDVFDDRGVNGD